MSRWSFAELWSDRRGVSAVVIALGLAALLGFAGLAIDVSLWYADKRAEQGAADSAAYSAAFTYNADGASGSASTFAIATAKAVAAQYGFVGGTNGVTVTVNNPPLSGTHRTSAAFEVIIAKTESAMLSVLQHGSQVVAARAVGAVVTTGGGGAACVLQTANTSFGEIYMTNGVTMSLNSCGVAANGTSSSAVTVIGGSSLTGATAQIVGNITTNNGGTVTISGSKTTGAAVTANPYASRTIAAAEAGYTIGCSAGASTPTSYNGGGQTYTINPGVFCGGLSVSNGVTVTMNPGIYIIYGGVFSLQSGTVRAGSGVTIVLTGTGSNYAVANIANGMNLTLNAPTSGATAGLAIFADPAAPSMTSTLTNASSCGTVASECSSFAGGVSMNINGAVDAPAQGVQWSNGSNNSTACTQLVAYQITFTGGSKFTNNCSGSGTSQIGGSSSTVSIVE